MTKTFKKHKSTASAVANKALREVQKLKQSVEVKHLDIVGNDGSLAVLGTTTDIFNPSTGTGDNARIGDKVTLKRVSMRMKIEALPAAVKRYGFVRVIILFINTLTTTIPSVTEILRSSVPYSLYNINTPVNYKVIHDQTYYMIDPTPAASPAVTGAGKAEYIIKKDFKINATHDNDGSNVKGRLVQLLVHDYENEDISVNWEYRNRFTDM